ncbi:putative DNA repair and recombination protein RAD54 [Cocos nucifera]|uniref:Putative DNA repair and recombination protein RAD54 n=1 Tax=Cocos nucifera TaxID=13894 RepID=A0A8K0I8F2_COCNU|nr:putative DNA repair and recombination protein RAD54 [Cocos nucifera]
MPMMRENIPFIAGKERTMKEKTILTFLASPFSASALALALSPEGLIYDNIKTGSSGTSGFDDCMRFFPPELFSGRSGSWTGGGGMWVELSGKMHVLARLLGHLRQKTDDRIVLVSNYTQTLDLFAQLCRERNYPYLRLDGTTSIRKRQKLVNRFNDPSKDEFVFLLSSKAGGCGLNLIGGNRLILFDPDWNPANDKQAAARVWRDGQKKRVYIYRFLSTGTIEEKVYQRQMSKEGLQKVIQQEHIDNQMQKGNFLSTEDLRDLFTFHENVRSEIHENMNCTRCKTDNLMSVDSDANEIEPSDDTYSTDKGNQANQVDDDIGRFAEIAGCLHKLKSSEKQLGAPSEEDLGSWGHHSDPMTVPDAILQSSAGDEITFVFTNQVDGKLVPVDSAVKPINQQLNEPKDSKQKDEKSPPSSQQLRPQPSTSDENCNRKSPMLSTPFLKRRTKLMRIPANSMPALKQPNTSLGNQSSLKRIWVASEASDDDFV